MHHPFLFEPRQWLGKGTIKLSMVEDELDFITRWQLGARDSGGVLPAKQEVQIQGVDDFMHNTFIIDEITGSSFRIELENATLGVIIGKGLIKETLIAWEFRDTGLEFEGFEFYEKQTNGSYLMRAEYATSDQYRTIIRGEIWEKQSE